MATHSVVGALIIIMVMHLFLTTKVVSTFNKNNNNASTTNNMNVIDSCWRRSKSSWASDRQRISGLRRRLREIRHGGKNGATYVVTHSSDNPRNPKPGTLRYGVIQSKPLWITFAKDMVITLKNELIINSYKTIDGRGAKVEISNGPCITIQGVTNIIVHGIIIRDCKPGKSGQEVRDSPTHAGRRGGSDGDAITIFGSSNVWIDHCYLARAADGLIDVIHGSTDITISNNYFTQHDKVMLFGHNDNNKEDKSMKVTVAFNHFGPGLIERMPRVRLGYAHVANNRYSGWLMYAIGGSANPIIFSEGNYFMAPNKSDSKQVTKREVKKGWTHWKWRSSKDKFLNGAYFVPSGYGSCTPYYTRSQSFPVADGSRVPALTMDAGPLRCSSTEC